jgi:hypothetical protein
MAGIQRDSDGGADLGRYRDGAGMVDGRYMQNPPPSVVGRH